MKIGQKVLTLRSWSGVPKFTEGYIVEDYGSGMTVAQYFRFVGSDEKRYACQVGKTEIYCPIIGQNTMGHSLSSGDEVYLKSDRLVELTVAEND